MMTLAQLAVFLDESAKYALGVAQALAEDPSEVCRECGHASDPDRLGD